LLGICDDATFEGEAAIALENVAFDGARGELPWTLRHTGDLWVYDVQPTLKGVVDSVRSGAEVGATAARFHQTIVSVTTEMCAIARKATGLRDVCLGGGVFQNRRLANDLLSSLRAEGFTAYLGEQVPVGDGGISYGQAAIAAARSVRR
jgi:hydrogenase maturation protein HypF